MNKFGSPRDEDYLVVVGKIQQFLREIRAGDPIRKANVWLRENHYTDEALKIERLSGELLPIAQCYINLAIVQQANEEPKKESEVSSFTLSSRLKVETPRQELQVKLPALFDSRKMTDGHTRDTRRILIRGRAGVGKSTLCKKVVHDYVHGDLWNGLFDLVLWIPLRELKQLAPFSPPNFSELLRHLYFAERPDCVRFSQELKEEINSAHRSRGTLFILDGLDEVAELLGSDTRVGMPKLIVDLLNRPNVVITSRPHANLPPGIKPVDLELETIGFYPDQVQKYLESVVKDPSRVRNIQAYLSRNPLVQDLVRIPIQLDAVCFTWDEAFDDSPGSTRKPKLETMTAVYQAIEVGLWKKDMLRLEKGWTQHRINKAFKSKLTEKSERERNILEFLAFSGMYSDTIDFQLDHREAVDQQCPPDNLLFDEVLDRLSFVRTSGPSTTRGNHQSYHFLHLTFQEYFAAQYIARHWKDDRPLEYVDFGSGKSKPSKIRPSQFLRQHKYTARYDIVWRFTAGLLGDEVSGLFNAIEQKPLDLLGPTH